MWYGQVLNGSKIKTNINLKNLIEITSYTIVIV